MGKTTEIWTFLVIYLVLLWDIGFDGFHRYFQHAHFTPISGCRKQRRIFIGPWWPAKPAIVRKGSLAPCRRTLGSERHRYAIAWPEKLGTDPMAYSGKHQIQPEYGVKQADAGRDCRTRLARPNFQARTRTGSYYFSLFSAPWAGLATLPGWSMLLLYVWPYGHTKHIYYAQK